MAINLEECVDGLDEDDSDDCKREIDDSIEDLIVKDTLVFSQDLMEQSAEGAKCEDDEGEGEEDDG